MKPNRTMTGVLLLVTLAFFGYLLVTIPPRLIEVYRQAQELGPVASWAYVGTLVVGSVLLAGASGWILLRLYLASRGKRRRKLRDAKNPSQLSDLEQQAEMRENLAAVEQLQQDEKISPDVRRQLSELTGQIEAKRESERLEIVAFGSISSGKSSLLNALAGRDVFRTDARGGTTVSRNEIPWPGLDQVTLVDTPGLGEIDGGRHAAISAAAAEDADLVLVVVDGPLRDYEFQLLDQLRQMEKRALVCLNKEDWYEPRERERLLGQIREQVSQFVGADDVVAVRAQPAERTRIRVLPSGEHVEEKLAEPPDIQALAKRMLRVVRREGRKLLLANLLLQSRGLVDDARAQVRQSLDQQAWQVVDRYTWAAGGAAALSPLPILDLVAGSAITAKMVVDLAHVYRQEMDLETATNLLGQLGKNLLAILGASVATPAVASGVATLLKAAPGAGTIAGGLLQGGTQAFVTRWIGSVFVKYFQAEMGAQNKTALSSLARREWDRLTTLGELRKFVKAAREQLTGNQEA